jgi:hypothetical protein
MFLNQYQTNFVAIIQQLFKQLKFDINASDRPFWGMREKKRSLLFVV